ncbi:hypothetical protein BBJ28_00010398, partial [Nothophytophthora sp. Chile5]
AAKSKNATAARASGVDESYSEKDHLLEELLSEVEDHQHQKAVQKEAVAAKDAAKEKAGEVVRQLAVERLKRRPEAADDSPAKPNKFARIVEVLKEHKEKEFEFRKEEWKIERKDRLEAERMRRLDSDRMLQLMELLARK